MSSPAPWRYDSTEEAIIDAGGHVLAQPESGVDGRRMAAAPELEEALRELRAWVGATAELLATVPRPQGGHSRTLLGAIESGRAWAREGSKASRALRKVTQP